jgi:NOL1/NOP2/fmu family ribosome biogenesis protein
VITNLTLKVSCKTVTFSAKGVKIPFVKKTGLEASASFGTMLKMSSVSTPNENTFNGLSVACAHAL